MFLKLWYSITESLRKVLGYFNILFCLAAFVVMQTTIPSPYSDMGSVPVISYMAFATGMYINNQKGSKGIIQWPKN